MNSLRPRGPFLVHNCLNVLNQQACYSSSIASKQTESKIRIPDYIPRGKTEILEALASTVKPSPHVLPYIYFHDPKLAPKNSREFKNYALSRESGVKAAKYFMQNYPQLFYRDQAEPKVEAFSYPDVFSEDMEFTLDDLSSSIEKRNVSNTIVAYEKLCKQQVDIPLELRLDVFELVCFFNSKDAFEYVEELPFTRKMTATLHERAKLWDESGLAERMWSGFFEKENIGRANTTYIQALVKYGAFDKAYLVHKSMVDKKSQMQLDAYNALFRALPFVTLLDHSTAKIESVLEEINAADFRPTIETVNAALFSLSNVEGQDSEVLSLAEKIFMDAKLLKLPLNLGSYYYMLNIYSRDAGRIETILEGIVNKLEIQPIHLASREDLVFFDEALRVCANYHQNYDLAIRIFNLFQKHSNMYLNIFRESNIYENFFITLAKTAPTEVLFEYFDRLCPGIFFPSPLLFTSMVDHLICFNGVDYIERFFTELNKYSYYNLNNLNNRIFHLIVSVPRNEKTDARFADFLLKSLESYANAQLRMDHDKSIERTIESISAILDHLVLLDRDRQVVEFIVTNGMDLQMIERRHAQRFYSHLLRKLIASEQADDAIRLLKFCVSKEVGQLEEELLAVVNKSNLKEKDKQMIKNLLIFL